MSEAEIRRSVRATKGQHTKAFEAPENGPEPAKRRQGSKRGSKKIVEKDDQETEEVIRCICGVTSQDDDATEPWIACDKCSAWQHNVCLGMSVFADDLPKEYYCEQCAPNNHKDTLAAMARGEKPWETRRQKYEEESKKKKGKKGKAKRLSDTKEPASPAVSTGKAKPSPRSTPEAKRDEHGPESTGKVKRKSQSQDHSQGPHPKLQKVSETKSVAPGDGPGNGATGKTSSSTAVPDSIQQLEGSRRAAAQLLFGSLAAAIDATTKKGLYTVPPDSSKEAIAERHATEIERAVHESHEAGTQSATSQVRALKFNLKNNAELAARVLNRSVAASTLAVMTSDEMATKEQQREDAEMKAKAEKQAIIVPHDGPRVRRTHKGEEFVNEADSFMPTTDDGPKPPRRQSVREKLAEAAKKSASPRDVGETETDMSAHQAATPLRINTGPAQRREDSFDIHKVFSAVRSPAETQQRRRPSAPAPPSAGAGLDPEVDRLLQDDVNDSPPYSPTETSGDPEVVWRGQLTMSSFSDMALVAKHMGGADLSQLKDIPWTALIPPLMTVAGKIHETKAVPYLCGLRYNDQIDLVITAVSPADADDSVSRDRLEEVINYFTLRNCYGVVGERTTENVRDTYLIPVLAGDGPIPEPVQNIGDHRIPASRPSPILLLVFIYRDQKRSAMPREEEQSDSPGQEQAPSPGLEPGYTQQPTAGTPVQGTHPADSEQSIQSWNQQQPSHRLPTHAPSAVTPVSHQANSSHQTRIASPLAPGQAATPATRQSIAIHSASAPHGQDFEALRRTQAEGEQRARAVLEHFFNCPSVQFLLPHAAKMAEREWVVVRRCMEADPCAQDDISLLSKLLIEEGNRAQQMEEAKRAEQATLAPSISTPTASDAHNTGTVVGPQLGGPAPANASVQQATQPTV